MGMESRSNQRCSHLASTLAQGLWLSPGALQKGPLGHSLGESLLWCPLLHWAHSCWTTQAGSGVSLGPPFRPPFCFIGMLCLSQKRKQLRILSSFSRLSKVTSFCLLLSSIHLFGVWSLPADSPGDRAGFCFAWSPLQTSQDLTKKVRSLSETHDLGTLTSHLFNSLLPFRPGEAPPQEE